MKEKVKKIAGVFLALAGILNLFVGIDEGSFSTILMGIGFCIIGSLYFFEKRK